MKEGWVKTTLGDVATIQSGSGFAEKYQGKTDQPIPFYKVSDMNIVGNEREMAQANNTINDTTRLQLRASLFPKGSTVFPKIGGAIATNKKRLTTMDCCVDNNVMGAIPKEDKVDGTFLYYFFQSFNLSDFANEAHLPSIKKSVVDGWPINVPLALSEQHRIVAILDEAFDGIATAKANAEKNLQNARALFASHLQSVFTEMSCVDRRLGDVVTRLTNGYVGPTRNIYHESGVPYLLARHVKNNRLTFDGRTFINNEFNKKNKKSMLKEGDVLLVQSGHIGHSAVVTKEHEGHNCHAMIVITSVAGAFIGPYLSLFFNSSGMQKKFQEIRSGSTVPHLTCKEVKELMIPLPDLVAQQRVVDRSTELVAETQRLESIYQQKLNALDDLKKSLLHQAFSGNL